MTAVAGLAGELGPRASFVGVLPTATLAVYLGGLLAAGAPAHAPEPGLLWVRASELSATEGGVLAIALVVVTVVTQPLQLPLVRLLEGYAMPRRLAERRRRTYRERRAALDAQQTSSSPPPAGAAAGGSDSDALRAAWWLRRDYPPAGRVQPTRLGNVLRAAEHRAGAPYGLDGVVAWPRLYPLLGDQVRAIVDDRRLQLDVAARFCATFTVAAVASAALLAPHGWWLALAPACLGLAAASYAAAVAAAHGYGESLDAAFDLHHLDLYRSLGLPVPESTAAEREAARALGALLSRANLGASVAYAPKDDGAPG